MLTLTRTDTSLIGRWWWTVDRWMLGAVLLLGAIGLVLTLAASPAVAERMRLDTFYFARRQAIYLPLAVIVMLVTSLMSPKGVRRSAVVGFVVALTLTVATLIEGEAVKGATRWIRFGGLSLQPSEFLKPAFAVLAAWLTAAGCLNEHFPGRILAAALLVTACGVLLLQPDVGTTLLIAGVWSAQLFLAGLPLALVGVIALLFVGGAVGAYLSFDHVRNRVDHFLDPSTGEGYQIARALEAFRSGGLSGRGPGEGRVKEILPDAHADFIFAVAGEEFGLAVCLMLVGLFAFVVLRGFARSLRSNDLFVLLAGGGLLALFGMQALMNMASTTHLIPPKGITLPFISYGGSSTIALAWGMGMVLALTRDRPGGGGIR
ncbi:MAG: putative lipid II flippase FtsW [Rhodospirillales bacterium]